MTSLFYGVIKMNWFCLFCTRLSAKVFISVLKTLCYNWVPIAALKMVFTDQNTDSDNEKGHYLRI